MTGPTPGSRRNPTLQDVADEAGVSLATASRVLNGSERKVADSYRARVESAARKVGYTANLSAQAIARGTTDIVSLLVADITDPYFSHIAAGVARGAEELGLVVTIGVTGHNPLREVHMIRGLRGLRPRGLILAASRVEGPGTRGVQDEIDELAGIGSNVVVIGPGEEAGRSVLVDNIRGAEALARELAGLGYVNAVIIAAGEGVRTSDDRIAGFTKGFTETGGSIHAVVHKAFTREAGYAAAGRLLAESVPPGTVIFGVSDVIALGAMSAIQDLGRDVGADIAVAGFDGIAPGQDARPGLTTVQVPLEELGYRAIHAAAQPVWESPAPLPLRVIVRGSTPTRR